MSQYVKFDVDYYALLQEDSSAIPAIPAIPEGQSSQNSKNSNPEPLTQDYPCVVCGNSARWDDAGIWRCRRCWPEPMTQAARLTAQSQD